MPRLSVISGEERRFISFEPGPTLRDILDTTDLRVRSGCRGSGVCGLCRVQIETGGHDRSVPASLGGRLRKRRASVLCFPKTNYKTAFAWLAR